MSKDCRDTRKSDRDVVKRKPRIEPYDRLQNGELKRVLEFSLTGDVNSEEMSIFSDNIEDEEQEWYKYLEQDDDEQDSESSNSGSV